MGNKGTRGGAQPGAGRPRGSIDGGFRKDFVKYWRDPEKRAFYLEVVNKKLMEGDTNVIRWVGNQIMGRPKQQIDVDGDFSLKEYVITTRDSGNQSLPAASQPAGDPEGRPPV